MAGEERMPPVFRKVFVLVRGLVVAGLAARFAVHQTVGAQADVKHGLAQAAVLLARAAVFRLFALCAFVFARTGSVAHDLNVAQASVGWNVTEVMAGKKLSIAD